MFSAACSGAVLAGQEAGPEVEQSSCCHPEHLEEVEGEIWKERVLRFTFPSSLFMAALMLHKGGTLS